MSGPFRSKRQAQAAVDAANHAGELVLSAQELLAEHGCILPIVTRSESIPGTWKQGPRWVSLSRERLGPEEGQ